MSGIVIEFEGEKFDYDPDSLLMSELSEIKKVTGLSRREWNQALTEEDVEAVRGLIFILKKRAGTEVRYSEIDGRWSSFVIHVPEDDASPPDGSGDSPSTA